MKDFSKTKLYGLLSDTLRQGRYEAEPKYLFAILREFISELCDYSNSNKNYSILLRSLNYASISFRLLQRQYTPKESSIIGLCLWGTITVILEEIDFIHYRIEHATQFVAETPGFQSNLFLVAKPKILTATGLAEIARGLKSTEDLVGPDGRPSTQMQISTGLEHLFNLKHGSVYDKRDDIFKRKTYNHTKALDSLRELVLRKGRSLQT